MVQVIVVTQARVPHGIYIIGSVVPQASANGTTICHVHAKIMFG